MEEKQELSLRQKSTFNNAEFLATYPTDDAQIDYYTHQAMEVFTEFQIDGRFSFEGVRTNVATWFHNKKPLMELLRKHPYWCEEAKAVVFLQDEKRTADHRKAKNMMCDTYHYVKHKISEYIHITMLDAVLAGLANSDQKSTLITQEFITAFNNRIGDKAVPKPVKKQLVVGTKINKFIRTVWSNLTIQRGMFDSDWYKTIDVTGLTDKRNPTDRDYDSFEKYYAKLADCLSELTIERITLVSLHFCDFMLMSHGNSWSSCHYINSHGLFHPEGSYEGMYKQGCLSYALDKPSMIMYVLPSSYTGTQFYNQPKMTRMCCQYHNGVLITGKCYPNNEDEVITKYRQIMQLVMSTAENADNMWTFSLKTERIKAFCTTCDESAHYPDYTMSKQKPSVSMRRGAAIDIDDLMEIGHKAYCLQCGEPIDSEGKRWLQCNKHRRSNICAHCGCIIDGDEIIIINDKSYCTDCCFYCNYHETWELIEDKHGVITTHDGDITICNEGFARHVQCKHCGKFVKKMGAGKYGDFYICDKCFNSNNFCRCCGKEIAHGNICDECKEHTTVLKQDRYEVNDYVLMAHDVSVCTYSSNSTMEKYYPDRIVKVTRARHNSDCYRVSNIENSSHDWSWSRNCFAGIVLGATDADIGLTMEEFIRRRQNES